MDEKMRLACRLHAALPQHQERVRRALQACRRALESMRRPYVSFSAGKDSTCVLHLVRSIDPGVPAAYFDADCAFPEADELLAATPNLIRFPCDEPFLETLKRMGLEHPGLEAETMRTTVYGPVRRLAAQYGFDGMFYGLRAEESRGRRLHCRSRGTTFRYGNGALACQPLAFWSRMDVWAYIVTHQLPYCGTYDRLWDAPPEDQRISYWAGETKRRWGRYAWLRRNYPELWNRLAAEIPEVRCYA